MTTSEARRSRGAMTMAMTAMTDGERVLRVGVVEHGTITAETTFSSRRAVRIGRAEDNEFVIGDAAAPARSTLFEYVDGGYHLRLGPHMTARVSSREGTRELASGTFALDASTRGRVAIGSASVLFQFVRPAPARTRPALPAAARGGFVAGIDWTFTAFTALSYLAFFAFVIYLDSADFAVEASLSERALTSEFALMEPPAPPPDEVAPDDTGEPTDETPERVASNTPRTPTHSPTRPSNVPDRASITERARAEAESMLIGAMGRDGALSDVLVNGPPTYSAADVLAQVDSVRVASNDRLTTQDGGGSGLPSDDFGRHQTTGPTGPVDEGPTVVERRILRATILDGGETGGTGGNFDESLVVSMIRGRQSAFRRCYEQAMNDDPTLGGRITVQFSIQPQGNVSGARATENSTGHAGLSQCVVRVFSGLRWRQGPEGGSISYSYPLMFARQQ